MPQCIDHNDCILMLLGDKLIIKAEHDNKIMTYNALLNDNTLFSRKQ